LNIRGGPGNNFSIRGVLKPDARGITLVPRRVKNGTTVWQEIFAGSIHGWVNAEYIEPEIVNSGGGHNLDESM
jgi:hypothetical protein